MFWQPFWRCLLASLLALLLCKNAAGYQSVKSLANLRWALLPRVSIELQSTELPQDHNALDEAGGGEEEGGGKLISNSEDNTRALEANEKSLPFYKSFGNWNSEYISAKVNSVLNKDIRVLNKMAKVGGERVGNKRSGNLRPSGLKGGTGNLCFKRRESSGDSSSNAHEVSIGEEEVRSGLLALLTLHELAAGPNTTTTGSSASSIANSASKWRNPESPQELERFTQEVERLGDGHSTNFATTSSGLRVAGLKASWKKTMRAERSGTFANSEVDSSTVDVLDLDRLIINDLAENLLKIIKEDIVTRFSRSTLTEISAAEARASPNANGNVSANALRAHSEMAELLSIQPRQRLATKKRRASGRERAKFKRRGDDDILSEYIIFPTASAGASANTEAATNRELLEPVVSSKGRGLFLASPKRFTEITKVTQELFVRKQDQLFRSGYCGCLNELCYTLLLWAERVQSVETLAHVVSAMAHYGKGPDLATVYMLFSRLRPAIDSPSPAFWPSFNKVFRSIKNDVLREAPRSPPVSKSSAAAVQLLKMGLTSYIRIASQSRRDRMKILLESRNSSGASHHSSVAVYPSSLVSAASNAAPALNFTNESTFNATEVYSILEAFLLLPNTSMEKTTGADTKSEFASVIVRSLIQLDQLDAALACFTLVLKNRRTINSKTIELLASKILTRGQAEDEVIALRCIDLLFQRKYLPSLGTLKATIAHLVLEIARKDYVEFDDWQPVLSLLRRVTETAPRADSRPRLLKEAVFFVAMQHGLEIPSNTLIP